MSTPITSWAYKVEPLRITRNHGNPAGIAICTRITPRGEVQGFWKEANDIEPVFLLRGQVRHVGKSSAVILQSQTKLQSSKYNLQRSFTTHPISSSRTNAENYDLLKTAQLDDLLLRTQELEYTARPPAGSLLALKQLSLHQSVCE